VCWCCELHANIEQLLYLTRKHGVKILPRFLCSVENCSRGVGEVVGDASAKSATWMNGAVLIFVETVGKAEELVERGIMVLDTHVPVLLLCAPDVKVTVPLVPPFVRDSYIEGELLHYSWVVYLLKKLFTGFKSPLQKHVLSHRRQCFMLLNNRRKDLNLVLRVNTDGFDYLF